MIQEQPSKRIEAVITVLGQDKVGILAGVSNICAKAQVNIEEVTQNILKETFAMIMLVDISKATVDFASLAKELEQEGKSLGVAITITRQEIFDAMHHV